MRRSCGESGCSSTESARRWRQIAKIRNAIASRYMKPQTHSIVRHTMSMCCAWRPRGCSAECMTLRSVGLSRRRVQLFVALALLRRNLCVIVPTGSRSLRPVTAERAHVCGELPHLLRRDLAAECGHAVRPALHDREIDLVDLAAVDPAVVHQRRAGAAAAMPMTTGAVERGKETLSLREVIGAVLVRMSLLLTKLREGLACHERAQRDLIRREVAAGRSLEHAVLAMTGGERQQEQEKKAPKCGRLRFSPTPRSRIEAGPA